MFKFWEINHERLLYCTPCDRQDKWSKDCLRQHHVEILFWVVNSSKKEAPGAPEQRYWQNRETANVGLDSSVGRAPARQSGGRRFKSRSSQFSLFIQIYLKKKQLELVTIQTITNLLFTTQKRISTLSPQTVFTYKSFVPCKVTILTCTCT